MNPKEKEFIDNKLIEFERQMSPATHAGQAPIKDFEFWYNKDGLKLKKDWLKEVLESAISFGKKAGREELLLDQLYRLEGILGKYNCQHGGTKCNFQVNCHRLIRKEINALNTKDE